MSISNEFADALVDDLRHQKSVVERLSGERDTLQSKLTEMEQCLAWCSENVWWIERFAVNAWAAGWTASRTTNRGATSPTLYAALKSAWEGRER